MESFWCTLRVELLNRRQWRTNPELAIAIADYIEHFYNSSRRHSSLGYLTPDPDRHARTISFPNARLEPCRGRVTSPAPRHVRRCHRARPMLGTTRPLRDQDRITRPRQ